MLRGGCGRDVRGRSVPRGEDTICFFFSQGEKEQVREFFSSLRMFRRLCIIEKNKKRNGCRRFPAFLPAFWPFTPDLFPLGDLEVRFTSSRWLFCVLLPGKRANASEKKRARQSIWVSFPLLQLFLLFSPPRATNHVPLGGAQARPEES